MIKLVKDMLIDTHSHLNFSDFEEDLERVIKRCFKDHVSMINIGTNFETSRKAIEIAWQHQKGVWAAIGLHPINLNTGLIKLKSQKLKCENREDVLEDSFDYQKYKKLAENEKVIAIGEVGLDYYFKPKTTKKKELFKEKQKELLLQELKLAQELNLPVIFHCRMAHKDLIKILTLQLTTYNLQLSGVMHGFVGKKEELEIYLKMGFYIGFNGIIFKDIEGINFVENIKTTPLDRILIESDCPFLMPPLFVKRATKEGRNEPISIELIANHIADIKGVDVEKVINVTTTNAKRLFNI